jgi:serine/threonine protein kinase
VLKPELGAVFRSGRFLDESKVTAGLQHSNLLPRFDSGASGGLLDYVMPYVEGQTLRARLGSEMDRVHEAERDGRERTAVAWCK